MAQGVCVVLAALGWKGWNGYYPLVQVQLSAYLLSLALFLYVCFKTKRRVLGGVLVVLYFPFICRPGLALFLKGEDFIETVSSSFGNQYEIVHESVWDMADQPTIALYRRRGPFRKWLPYPGCGAEKPEGESINVNEANIAPCYLRVPSH